MIAGSGGCGLLYLICMLATVELLGLKETPVCINLKALFFTIGTQVYSSKSASKFYNEANTFSRILLIL